MTVPQHGERIPLAGIRRPCLSPAGDAANGLRRFLTRSCKARLSLSGRRTDLIRYGIEPEKRRRAVSPHGYPDSLDPVGPAFDY